MAIQHADIADPHIHEPKGIGAAGANTVYVSNGGGTGQWKKVDVDALDTDAVYADIQTDLDSGIMVVKGRLFITARIDDVSTASTVQIPIIQDCTVVGASFVLGDAIATADATVSIKNSAGASMGTPVTVAYDGSTKGDQYPFTATGNNELVGPTWIEIATDGASTNAVPLFATIEIEYAINDSL